MPKIIIEACCGSVDDVIESQKAGADRVELNSSLFQGGLTPTVGELIVSKKLTEMPIMAMVRPREGGFCYTDAEFKTALMDAEMLLKNGADGIVFGFLNPDGTINAERCLQMKEIIGNRQAVFHRAMDVVPDWRTAMDQLCDIGITRVLTSGQAPSVPEGARTIAEMIEYAKERIEILPGGGIRQSNVQDVIATTGCRQVHLSPHKVCYDLSTAANPSIHFGGALYPPEDRFSMIDRDVIGDIRQKLQ